MLRVLLMSAMLQRFAAHGFHHEETGGNCTALVCYTPDAEWFIVRHTKAHGPESIAPERWKDRVCVGRVPVVDGAPVGERWETKWTGRASDLLASLDAEPRSWLGIGNRRGCEFMARGNDAMAWLEQLQPSTEVVP